MLDDNAILAQVRAGSIPSNWQVIHPSQSHFIQNMIVGLLLAIGAVAAAFYLLISGTVYGYGLSDSSPDGVVTFWLIVDMLVLLAVLITGIVRIVRQVRGLSSLEEQVMVLLPEGFIMRRGSRPKDLVSVDYRAVGAMRTSVESGNVYLLVQPLNQRGHIKIQLDTRFGKPKELAKQITGMQSYIASQVQAR